MRIKSFLIYFSFLTYVLFFYSGCGGRGTPSAQAPTAASATPSGESAVVSSISQSLFDDSRGLDGGCLSALVEDVRRSFALKDPITRADRCTIKAMIIRKFLGETPTTEGHVFSRESLREATPYDGSQSQKDDTLVTKNRSLQCDKVETLTLGRLAPVACGTGITFEFSFCLDCPETVPPPDTTSPLSPLPPQFEPSPPPFFNASLVRTHDPGCLKNALDNTMRKLRANDFKIDAKANNAFRNRVFGGDRPVVDERIAPRSGLEKLILSGIYIERIDVERFEIVSIETTVSGEKVGVTKEGKVVLLPPFLPPDSEVPFFMDEVINRGQGDGFAFLDMIDFSAFTFDDFKQKFIDGRLLVLPTSCKPLLRNYILIPAFSFGCGPYGISLCFLP